MAAKRPMFLSVTSVIIYFLSIYSIQGKNCEFNVRVEQSLHNEGFHRNYTINVDFASDDESERWLYVDCMVGIEVVIPTGLYASYDEIQDKKCEGLIEAVFLKQVNIEVTAENSEPIIIQLLTKVTDYRTHVDIPVHARYHEAVAGGGYVKNEIPSPKVNLMCPDGRLDECDNLYSDVSGANSFCDERHTRQECNWKEVPIIMTSPPLLWQVPVGDTDRYHLVLWVTACVVLFGTLYFIKQLHTYNVMRETENAKKSN